MDFAFAVYEFQAACAVVLRTGACFYMWKVVVFMMLRGDVLSHARVVAKAARWVKGDGGVVAGNGLLLFCTFSQTDNDGLVLESKRATGHEGRQIEQREGDEFGVSSRSVLCKTSVSSLAIDGGFCREEAEGGCWCALR